MTKKEQYLRGLIRKQILAEIKNGNIDEGWFSNMISGLTGATKAAANTPVGQTATAGANKVAGGVNKLVGNIKGQVEKIKTGIENASTAATTSYNMMKKAYVDAAQKQALVDLEKGVQDSTNKFFAQVIKQYVPVLQKQNIGAEILVGKINSAVQTSLLAFAKDVETAISAGETNTGTTAPETPALNESYRILKRKYK